MTTSYKSMLRILQQTTDLDISQLGFVLTVIRDNCFNDDTYKVLDFFVHYIVDNYNSK